MGPRPIQSEGEIPSNVPGNPGFRAWSGAVGHAATVGVGVEGIGGGVRVGVGYEMAGSKVRVGVGRGQPELRTRWRAPLCPLALVDWCEITNRRR